MTIWVNGADLTLSKLADDDEKLVNWYKEKGLTKKDYYLVVGRFVPENSFEVMIREFMKSKSKKNFAIITNVNEKFLNELEEKLHFKSDKRIKFVGTVYDQELLKKIRENAYAMASIEKTLPQVERRLETLQQQLAEAKEEVQRPFPQEAELNEKSARLAELNALLDMDEKRDDAALGMDEEVTDSELPAPKREIERSADSVKRPSILAQLHEKQAERMAEPKPQKKKSHDMEL